ncbi:MAG: DMT family transporter [Candidatus Azobacteroides sp.]|nr:DMT family transporter [Candidatus Azobacteroides sp.]
MVTDKDIKGHVAMFFAGALWGLNSPVMKSILNYEDGMITPMSMSLFRMVGAAALFWIASIFAPREHVKPHDMLLLFFASLFAIVLNQGVFAFGLSLTTPLDASIITTTTPIITMILAAIFLKEPITNKKIGGVFIGATGALLLILSSQHSVNSSSPYSVWGDLLCLLAQISFSIYLTVYKGLIQRYSVITLMKWMFVYASACFIPFSFRDVSSIDFAALSPAIWGKIAFAVVGATFITFLFLSYAQKKLRPTIVSMYNYLQPIVAGIVAVYLGMDTFGVVKGLAVVLVFLGVYVVTQSKSKARMDAEARSEHTGNFFHRMTHPGGFHHPTDKKEK